jgi:hypothetical protein
MDFEERGIGMRVLLFIFVACLYFLIRRGHGDYYISKALTEIFVVAFLIISSQTVLWVSRYYMPHVTVNGLSGSILGRPTIIKGSGTRKGSGLVSESWAVFNTGESLEPVHIRGKLATLIIPYSQLRRAGRNFVARTFVRKVPFHSVPPCVYSYLVHYSGDYNTENIFFGKFTEEFEADNPNIMDQEAHIQQLNTQVNLRGDLLEGRNDMLVEMKKFAEEMSGSRKKWFEIFKRSKEADEE